MEKKCPVSPLWDKTKSVLHKDKHQKKQKVKKSFKAAFKDNLITILSAYAIALFIRLLLIEAYRIPSQSMLPTLKVGDILLVEKLTYGAFIPGFDKKFFGLGRPRRNDIVVFISPDWKNPGIMSELVTFFSFSLINLDNTFDNPKNLVKRVIGLPGETVAMNDQKLYIDDKAIDLVFLAKELQPVYMRGRQIAEQEMDIYKEDSTRIVQHWPLIEHKNYNMSVFDSNSYEENPYQILQQTFPKLYIPRRGDMIILTTKYFNYYQLMIYSKAIQHENPKRLVTIDKNGQIYLDSQPLAQWSVKEDYYFMMGDNRDFSEDSRYFGLVPRSSIYGKVFFRYYPLSRMSFSINAKEEDYIK